MEGIIYNIGLPSFHNTFPKKPPVSELERVLNEAFATRGMGVHPDYFNPKIPLYPRHLSFFIFAYDANNANKLVGAIIATEEVLDGFTFTIYDKIAVPPPYNGNGIMTEMIRLARRVSDGKKIHPTILRTSSLEASKRYERHSDPPTHNPPTQIGEYYIHGFGFLSKDGKELFPDAKHKFELVAKHIASKPPTIIPIEQQVAAN